MSRVVKRGQKNWLTCNRLAFRSKNIFNLANSYVRRHFFCCRQVLGMSDIYRRIKDSEAYRGLPRKVSTQLIWQVNRAWRSYVAAVRECGEHPEKFQKPPRISGEKDKVKGRNIVVYDCQAVSGKALKKGLC